MKKIIILLCAIAMFGCSDDEENIAKDNSQWTIVFNEIMYSDSHPVTKTEKLLFDHERLIQHSVKQQYFEEEINNEVNLAYADNKVTITAFDQTSVYTLNAEAYASECEYSTSSQNRHYSFSYSTGGYLTGIDETINGKTYSTTTLAYDNGDLISIRSQLNDIDNKIIYEPGENNSKYNLPCLGLLEIHPFAFHAEAIYAGLLGKSPQHFTVRTHPEGNDNEYTKYIYEFDKDGNPTHIKGKTTYPGGNSGSYYPNSRNISISYE